MDRLLTKRDEIGDGKVDIVDVTKEASKVWANISQDEMEVSDLPFRDIDNPLTSVSVFD